MAKKRSGALHKGFFKRSIDAAYLSKPAHLRTIADRYEAGRALRKECPREAQAEFVKDRSDRPDPIKMLIASGAGRIESLLPIRYGRMLASPLAFYRGAASIMAADLAESPATGYAVQACGDCHLLNFGAFATPERNVVFDINDFDETFPAPWEWDLKRLTASFVIASFHNGHKASDCKAAAAHVVECYRDKLKELAEMSALSAWYSFLDYEQLIEMTTDPQLKKMRKEILNKAARRKAIDEFIKMAHVVDGSPKIKDNPPLIFHPDRELHPDFQKQLLKSLDAYRESLPLERRILFDRYEFADSAIKVVGVGSVGMYCAVALFFAADGDPLFLQIKEARKSVLEPYVSYPPLKTEGKRVVFGQRLLQASSDIFLGHYVDHQGKHLYVRQLRDVKIKPLVEIFSPENMLGFARNCGWALARAHARSGDPAIIYGYIGKSKVLPEAISQFAMSYAEQNSADHARLKDAIKRGAIKATIE